MVTSLMLAAALAAPHPPQLLPLPAALDEISGIVWDGRQLWAHNDSGDSARLFRFSARGEPLGQVRFSGVRARDWEDVASDGEHLFVADCGNNRGNREDLTIYRTPIPEGDGPVSAGSIHFSFAEQTDFSRKGYTHNFDCEALVATKESLWVFSKNWGNGRSRVYKLPKTPGSYRVEAQQSLPVWGYISAADWQPQTGKLALLGYRGGLNFNAFVWIADLTERGVDWEHAKEYRPVADGQWEALTWISPDTLLLGRESSDVSDAGWQLWQPPQVTE